MRSVLRMSYDRSSGKFRLTVLMEYQFELIRGERGGMGPVFK
jgi:hypothetical protein